MHRTAVTEIYTGAESDQVPKISVLLSANDDELFSKYCEEKGCKKSTLIARLIRKHLDAEGYAVQAALPIDSGSKQQKRT